MPINLHVFQTIHVLSKIQNKNPTQKLQVYSKLLQIKITKTNCNIFKYTDVLVTIQQPLSMQIYIYIKVYSLNVKLTKCIKTLTDLTGVGLRKKTSRVFKNREI